MLTIIKTTSVSPGATVQIFTDKKLSKGRALAYTNKTTQMVEFVEGEKHLDANFKEIAITCNGNLLKY